MKVMVFDVGGTEIKYSVMDEQLNRADAGSVPTPGDTQEHFLATLEALYRPHAAEVDGIAMSLPGFIDAEHGVVRGGGAPSLLYNIGTPVGPRLAQRCGCRVFLENDGKAAAIAELQLGRPERLHQRRGLSSSAPAWAAAWSSTDSWYGASTARLGNTATSTPMQMTGATAIKRWRCSAVSPTCCAGTAPAKICRRTPRSTAGSFLKPPTPGSRKRWKCSTASAKPWTSRSTT